MNTDKQLAKFNQEVYKVDPNFNPAKTITEGSIIPMPDGKRFQVISTKNGFFDFQGMAVAPVIDGHVEYSQVTVVAAGTDPSHPLDLLGAVDARTDFGSLQEPAAEQFIQEIKTKHPDWHISQLSGYSQSAYMLKVGAKFQISTTIFNGWFQYGSMSEKEQAFMKSHSDWFINYRRKNDTVTKWNDSNSELLNSEDFGTIVWLEGDSHNIADWKFDKEGMILLPKNSEMSTVRRKQKENLLAANFSQSMLQLKSLRSRFSASGGGLSSGEKIYLDSAQALAIVSTASAEFDLAMVNVMKTYQDGIKEQEKLWEEGVNMARNMGNLLETWEVYEAFETTGFTYENIVTFPVSQYQYKMDKARAISQ
ncbi:MAG: hypothetical protein LBS33_03640 [Streptococcaceae bacterium]|jgi:hypothetical protein|nr:hypothetical protein [Streptococcaceae bacterium]